MYRFTCTILAVGILLLSACRKSAETSASPTPQSAPAQATAATAERHHKLFSGGVSPLIVSMSPQTVPFHDGHLPAGRYALTYEINNSEKATKAFIVVSAYGVGEVQRSEVDVLPRAQIEFLLDPSNFDFGPTVRFRAHCPFGDTGWFIMGGDSQESSQPASSREIGNVTPPYVEIRQYPSGSAIPIEIRGPQITRECTPEAQVDYTTVELQNVVAGSQKISALLPVEALHGRPVAARHLEVNLLVYGPSIPPEDTFNLDFVE